MTDSWLPEYRIRFIARRQLYFYLVAEIHNYALEGLGEDAKVASAFMVMAIVGGAIMPVLQGLLIDVGGRALDDYLILGVPEVNFSFILPLICFLVVGCYGFSTRKPLIS